MVAGGKGNDSARSFFRAEQHQPIRRAPQLEGTAGLQALALQPDFLTIEPPAIGVALGAAPTAIPGVVFEGAGDGRLFAVSSTDGALLWQFNTAQEFKTVNNVMARGGAIAASGAVIVDGMVYVGSGYAINNGATAGNVLLAFGFE